MSRIQSSLRTLLLLAPASLLCSPLPATAQVSQLSAAAPYTPTMKFDVTSIRESPEADSYTVSGSFADHASTLRLTNWSIDNLLSMAYGLDHYQLSGLPNWQRTMFMVEAKADSETDQQLAKLSEKQTKLEQQHMLQTLLIDRFNLKTHWETRQGPTYRLIIKGKGKLQETKGGPPTPEELKTWGNSPIPPIYQQGDGLTGFDYTAHNCSIDELSQALAGQFGRPVSNETALTGHYDFVLHYKDAHLSDRDINDKSTVPPLDQAIQDQLGLKLEATKGPIQTLVIDHIDKPSPN